MANSMRYREGPRVDRWISKTGTVAIEQGDMVMINVSTGKINAVSAATNSTGLIAVSMGASPATDRTATYVRVRLIGKGSVFEMDCASGTSHVYGHCFLIASAQGLLHQATDNISISGTNIVAICARDMSAAGEKVLVEFLPGNFDAEISSVG